MKKRKLILEDGSVYEGYAFGSDNYQVGELVFNTGMSGYQEVLSDLSYCGQIVMMTYPMIGNYGINRDDFESLDPAVFGFVVRECCEMPSNFRSDLTLDEFLKLKNIPGIYGVDTRSITRKLRSSGTMRAIMAETDSPIRQFLDTKKVERFLSSPSDYGKPWYGQLMAAPQMIAYLIQVNYWLEKYHIKIEL